MNQQSTALVGFAVLRANYNSSAPSYIDNFRGFVLGVLAEHQDQHITRDVIASSIHDSFGIDIPDLVVDKIIKRARHTQLVDADNRGYFLTAKGFKQAPAVRGLRDKYMRQQRELEDRLKTFIASEFADHAELLEAAAAEELARYLERHAVPLMATSFKGRAFPKAAHDASKSGFEFVLSKFVTHLAERDSTGFGYLEEAAKGAILASVVTLDTSSFKNSLKNLSVYIDTPVLIDLLGFGGTVTMRATHQLLELLKLQGAAVKVFEHSMREIDGVLQGAEQYARNSRSRPARPIDLHFQDQEWSAVDIELARINISASLDALKIKVVGKPDGYSNYGLDETALEKALQDAVHYKSENTRRFDVDSLSAIHRLRKGSSRGNLDRCVALLLTDNNELARAAEMSSERHEWPLAMTDSALAGILWARSPAVGTDLPRHMVLASAYAGMQPDPYLWSRYVDEVDTLENRGEVSSDEAILLRSTTTGRDALMEETLGVPSDVTAISPRTVLRRIQDEISQPIRELARSHENDARDANSRAASTERSLRDEAAKLQHELAITKENTDALNARYARERAEMESAIDSDSLRRAQLRIRSAVWLVASLLIMATALDLVSPPWMREIPPAATWTIGVLAFIATALAIAQAVGIGTVTEWLRPLESKLARRIGREKRRSLGLS